jgi:hypothetical protein
MNGGRLTPTAASARGDGKPARRHRIQDTSKAWEEQRQRAFTSLLNTTSATGPVWVSPSSSGHRGAPGQVKIARVGHGTTMSWRCRCSFP